VRIFTKRIIQVHVILEILALLVVVAAIIEALVEAISNTKEYDSNPIPSTEYNSQNKNNNEGNSPSSKTLLNCRIYINDGG
jgi:hypothetical protein